MDAAMSAPSRCTEWTPAEFEALLDFFYEEYVKSPTLWALFCLYESLKEIPTP
jgi:hypothetical protein